MVNREQERAELYSTIWKLANDLRGSVDGWDFKQYILGFLFYRYISENISQYIDKDENELLKKEKGLSPEDILPEEERFYYANISDSMVDEDEKASLVREKGFFIYPSELFCNIVKQINENDEATNTTLNETLRDVFRNIENSAVGTPSEDDFSGLFADIDINSNKLGASVVQRNIRLKKIIRAISEMKLGDYQNNQVDAFGDTYEYLMGMYASNAGKSGGEYFTPQEVSELLAKITLVGKTRVNKVYDPTAGSGSLLLKFAKILGKENVTDGFYGQEINITTYNLCRINMFLHDIGFEKFNIQHGDTLLEPKHTGDEPFEAIVSNPPYSIKWEGSDNGLLINDPRFAPAGVLAPKSKADLAFVMHCLSWLATNGTAAIVCFPGVMYRGGAEQKIRKYLVDNNYVEAVIQLPGNLFYGTSISTCILVLKKSKVNGDTMFIDASKEFVKETNTNKLTNQGEGNNVENILSLYKDRKDVEYKVHVATREEIEEQDYSLSVSNYVEAKSTKKDINITELNAEIEEIVAKQNELRISINQIIKDISK